jgi:hypothetical protein
LESSGVETGEIVHLVVIQMAKLHDRIFGYSGLSQLRDTRMKYPF